MKKIELTKDKVVLVDDDDFEKLSRYKWHFGGGYAKRTEYINKKRNRIHLMHREILGEKNTKDIDHINCNRLDNRKTNLRFCTKSENGANRGKNKNNTSGYKCVYFREDRKKWCAYIHKDKRKIHIGYFNKVKDAINARMEKSVELFGEFAR